MTIEASSIEKWYFRGKGDSNRFFAVQKTSLTLESGKVTVLTGRSGSGKTTLLQMLSGLLVPSGGTVLADGQNLYQMNDAALSFFRNRRFGMIPQGAELLPALTVKENILLPQGIWPEKGGKGALQRTDGSSGRQKTDGSSSRQKTDGSGTPQKAEELLELMEIADLAGVPARELSGGERRRVCIARALAGTPDVIFADEPTSDLDDENMQTVLRLLRREADNGASVFIVTHDSEALDYADVRLHMNAGVLSGCA